jgi:hypothetical protein
MVAIHSDMEKILGNSPRRGGPLSLSQVAEKNIVALMLAKMARPGTRCEELSDFLANHIPYASRSVGLRTHVEAVKRGRRLSSNAFCNPKNEDQIKSGESEDTSVLHSARAKAIRAYRSLLGHLAGP